MRIHALSRSAAVKRTLEAIVLASGHEPVTETEAEFTLADAASTPGTPHWRLGQGASQGQPALPLPIAPQQLIRLLQTRLGTQTLPLGNGWALDPLARQLQHDTQTPAPLTEKECALLAALLRAYPAPVEREQLLAEVWGMAQEADTHTLETHIYRLRHKCGALVPSPGDIRTEDGAYRWLQETV